MEVWVELKPYYGVEIAAKALKHLSYADKIDVPDQPVGIAFSSPVISAYLAAHLGSDRIVSHVRTVDHTPNSLKAVLKTLSSIGISDIVLLTGDPVGPKIGLRPEEAIRVARKYKERFGLQAGFIVSLRKDYDVISKRLALNPDFILVLNATKGYLWKLDKIRRVFGGRIYVYLVVAGESSERVGGKIKSVMMTESDLIDLAQEIAARGLADGFLVSSPADDDLIERVSRAVKRLGKS